MPSNIGQFRRTQSTNYETPLTYTKKTVLNEDAIINFYDPCLSLSGSNTLSFLYSYYLKFTIAQRTDSAQNFIIYLKNNEAELDNIQEIKSFSVKQGTDSTTFELIFHPNGSYDEIVFELSRMSLDFYLQNDDGTSGRLIDITIEQFSLVNNIITTLSSLYSGLETITKIGIQGPPGMLFCLDGEEIRIGRSGIYELYNDNIEISYIGFIIKDSLMTQDGKEFFLMDFKY